MDYILFLSGFQHEPAGCREPPSSSRGLFEQERENKLFLGSNQLTVSGAIWIHDAVLHQNTAPYHRIVQLAAQLPAVKDAVSRALL